MIVFTDHLVSQNCYFLGLLKKINNIILQAWQFLYYTVHTLLFDVEIHVLQPKIDKNCSLDRVCGKKFFVGVGCGGKYRNENSL